MDFSVGLFWIAVGIGMLLFTKRLSKRLDKNSKNSKDVYSETGVENETDFNSNDNL